MNNLIDLMAPIPKQSIKSYTKEWVDKKTGEKKKSKPIPYITARTVMNRLDGVVGPGNWRDEYEIQQGGTVKCTLYVRVDNEWIGKQDIGTETDIEEDKGAFSDAFKRAAVKWGIGRELYGDGTVYDMLHNGGSVTIPPAESRPTTRAERSTVEQDAPHSDEVPAAASELDAVTWTRDPKRLNNLVKWAMTLWPDCTVITHAHNRVAKALGVSSWAALPQEYMGTAEDAMRAIQGYESDHTDQLGTEQTEQGELPGVAPVPAYAREDTARRNSRRLPARDLPPAVGQ